VRFGDFSLQRRLGAGGMAEVFLARREGPRGFEKQLVVKRLLPHLSRSSHFTRMFLREAQFAALIDHPNFVHVHTFGEFEGDHYLVMEYVDGVTISQLLDLVERVPIGAAVRIAIDLLDALHAIHSARNLDGAPLNLVHRDDTPRNVMLTAAGSVKLLDLGIAVTSDEVTPPRAGTRRYMSPEQARGKTLDPRADLYCVGLLLGLMVNGRHPFDQTIAEITAGLPRELGRILEWTLAFDREQRPDSARTLQEALEHFALGCGRESTRPFLAQIVAGVASHPPSRDPSRVTASLFDQEGTVPISAEFEGAGPTVIKPNQLQPARPPRPSRFPMFALALLFALFASWVPASTMSWFDWPGSRWRPPSSAVAGRDQLEQKAPRIRSNLHP
jgi:serine/threonine protein kinase